MKAGTRLNPPVHVSDDEVLRLAELARTLDSTSSPVSLTVGQSSVELPDSLVSALSACAKLLAEGQQIVVLVQQTELSPQQAAGLLNISRPYVTRLLDQGEIPFHRVGSHRRIRLSDLLAYRDQRDTKRREDLQGLSRMSREFGVPE